VIFGILAFVLPGITLLGLILLFGAFALVNGVFAFGAAFRGARGGALAGLILGGLASIVAGLLAFFLPGLTALALLYLIASWAVVTGIFEIVAAIRLRREISNEWLLVLAGVVSIAFGVLLALLPAAGLLTLVWWIGAYSLVFGTLQIALAFRLRAAAAAVGEHARAGS
jgi:uncharacterized membrane protein HdeD (DUF308 family)